MQITKSKLKKIIQEELASMLDEQRRGAESEEKAVTTTKTEYQPKDARRLRTSYTQPVKWKGGDTITSPPSDIATRLAKSGAVDKVHGTRKELESLSDVITARGGDAGDIEQAMDVWQGKSSTHLGDWPGEKKTLDLPDHLKAQDE